MRQLSIVIPVYNEAAILEREVTHIVEEVNKRLPGVDYEVFLVENGSTDETAALADGLAKRYPQVRVSHMPVADYGLALKHCILNSDGYEVAIFNIDFWDVNFLLESRRSLSNGADLVIGSKTMAGARDSRPFLRRLVTKGFNLFLRVFFGFRGTDTHGLKLLRADSVLPLVRQCRTDRLIFDTEFVLRTQRAGLNIREVPVECEEKRATRLHIGKSVGRTLRDLAVLFFVFHRPNLSRFQAVALGAVVVFFFGAVFWGFPDSPSPWFDQGVNSSIAKTIAQDGVFSLRLGQGEYVQERSLMISTNYPVLLPIALSFKLFGVGLGPAVVVMVIFMSLFLLAVYRLVRSISSSATPAILALALIATFLPFYGNGLSAGLGEVPGLLFFFVGLLLFETKNPWRTFMAGVFFGLAASTKVFYLMSLGALAVGEIWLAVRARQLPLRRWLLLAAGILMPLLIWYRILWPSGFTLSAFQKASQYYGNPYDVQNMVWKNLLRFFTEVTPLHFTLLFVVIVLWSVWRLREHQLKRSEIVLLALIIFTLTWFVRTPGWYRYFFPAHLIVLAIFPVALWGVVERLSFLRSKRFVVFGISFFLLAAQTIHFFQQRPLPLYHNPEPRLFGDMLNRTLPVDASITVIDQPELWFFLSNTSAQQHLQMNPYVAFGEDFFSTSKFPRYVVINNPATNSYIVAHKETFSTRYMLKEQYGRYQLYSLK